MIINLDWKMMNLETWYVVFLQLEWYVVFLFVPWLLVSSIWICLDEKLISCRTVELPSGYMNFCGPVLKTLQNSD